MIQYTTHRLVERKPVLVALSLEDGIWSGDAADFVALLQQLGAPHGYYPDRDLAIAEQAQRFFGGTVTGSSPQAALGGGFVDTTAGSDSVEKYSEDQPRDEHGRWTSGGGYQFYSPNEKENLSFAEASAALNSDSQKQFLEISRDVDRGLGLEAKPVSAIGDWSDGAENSVLNTIKNAQSFDQVRYSAAIKGEIAHQKAVIPFFRDATGPDTVYRFEIDDKVENVRQSLDKAGLQFRTLLPHGDKTGVVIFDPGSELKDKVGSLGGKYAGLKVSTARGRGEFLGGDTREAGHHAYQEVIHNWESSHLSGRPGRLERATDHWDQEAVIKYSEDEPRDDHGRWTDAGTALGMHIPQFPLTPAQEKVATRFREQIASNPEHWKEVYRQKFGTVLNADNAKELSPDYQRDRSSYALAVHEPASWLIKQMFNEELKRPQAPGRTNTIVFTAGGAGAGKTTALEGSYQAVLERAHAVYDGTMRPADKAEALIAKTLGAGKKASVFFIYRDPIDAFKNGVLSRAMHIGRTVPIEEFARQHTSVQASMENLQNKFGTNPDFALKVIDNSRGFGHAQESTLSMLPAPMRYEDLLAKLHEVIEDEHRRGAITDKIYHSTLAGSSHKEIGV